MKCLVILLVISVALRVNADKKEKRGIFHEHSYGTPLAAPLEAAHIHAAPLPTAIHAAAPLPAAQHIHAEFPSQQLFAPAHFAAEPLQFTHDISPIQSFAAGYAVQSEPVQVKTIVKKISVPYERVIPIDNPIYTPIERPIKIDNPVPVFKLVEQPVPVHVDHQIPVPVVKEIHVPQPYVHKVKLVLQKVLVHQPPQQHKTIIVHEENQHGGGNHGANQGWEYD